ncbi:MAG: RNA polymerase sigma-70 factor (ECF subfamily) [Planctomycetota bacterium]|jgi:RNA polymerase sigma-70 factor (ECF subfamily)
MTSLTPQTITRLLQAARDGEPGAVDSLMPLVYGELGELAARIFSGESGGHTLQPTALIHEAWIKVEKGLGKLENRQHFYAVASLAMRQVLTDHARALATQKRGNRGLRVTLDGALVREIDAVRSPELDLVELNELLAHLEECNPRHGRLVELRVFGGLTIAESAEVLGVSEVAIERDWFMAKAWLRTRLAPPE